MNERIKDLLKQATRELNPDDREWVFSKVDQARFAELIVRECMEQVWYTREDGINGNVSEVIKERMKEHFGVKE